MSGERATVSERGPGRRLTAAFPRAPLTTAITRRHQCVTTMRPNSRAPQRAKSLGVAGRCLSCGTIAGVAQSKRPRSHPRCLVNNVKEHALTRPSPSESDRPLSPSGSFSSLFHTGNSININWRHLLFAVNTRRVVAVVLLWCDTSAIYR